MARKDKKDDTRGLESMDAQDESQDFELKETHTREEAKPEQIKSEETKPEPAYKHVCKHMVTTRENNQTICHACGSILHKS